MSPLWIYLFVTDGSRPNFHCKISGASPIEIDSPVPRGWDRGKRLTVVLVANLLSYVALCMLAPEGARNLAAEVELLWSELYI